MDVGTGADEQQNDNQETLETEYGRLYKRERAQSHNCARILWLTIVSWSPCFHMLTELSRPELLRLDRHGEEEKGWREKS